MDSGSMDSGSMDEFWDSIAAQFLQHYPRGTRLFAVAGADAGRSRTTADEIAAALERAGQSVQHVHTSDGDEEQLRHDVVGPFRAERPEGVLLVSGPGALLSQTARGIWHFTVWQLAGEEQPHAAASTLVDVSDPEHPARRFADYCALPAEYGA